MYFDGDMAEYLRMLVNFYYGIVDPDDVMSTTRHLREWTIYILDLPSLKRRYLIKAERTKQRRQVEQLFSDIANDS